MYFRFLVPASVCFLSICASAETLPALLARMDKAAESFQSMSASLEQTTYTEVIDTTEKQVGSVKLKKAKAGLLGRVDFTQPQLVIGFHDRKVEKFYPATKVVEVYDVGKHGDKLDQFLLLGFGTSGQELQKNYSVKLVGDETIAGKPSTHIELTPKSKEALEYFKKAHLWIAQGAATYPVQEQIFTNVKDYTKVVYRDVQLNPSFTEKSLELTLPSGVKRITPGK